MPAVLGETVLLHLLATHQQELQIQCMHCSLLLIMYIFMFKQNRRLFICTYTVAHFTNINPVYELKDMLVERENWKGLGCIFVVVTCDWQ